MYKLCIVDEVTIWVVFAFSCAANSGGFAWIRVFTNQRTAVDNGDQTFKGIHEEHGGLELGVSYILILFCHSLVSGMLFGLLPVHNW